MSAMRSVAAGSPFCVWPTRGIASTRHRERPVRQRSLGEDSICPSFVASNTGWTCGILGNRLQEKCDLNTYGNSTALNNFAFAQTFLPLLSCSPPSKKIKPGEFRQLEIP